MHKIKTGEKEESYDCPLCFIKNVVLVFFYPWQNIINSSVSRESLSQLLLIRSKWNYKHWETPGRRSQLRLFFSLFQKYSQSVPSCLRVTQFSQEEVSDKGNPSLFIPNSTGGGGFALRLQRCHRRSMFHLRAHLLPQQVWSQSVRCLTVHLRDNFSNDSINLQQQQEKNWLSVTHL